MKLGLEHWAVDESRRALKSNIALRKGSYLVSIEPSDKLYEIGFYSSGSPTPVKFLRMDSTGDAEPLFYLSEKTDHILLFAINGAPLVKPSALTIQRTLGLQLAWRWVLHFFRTFIFSKRIILVVQKGFRYLRNGEFFYRVKNHPLVSQFLSHERIYRRWRKYHRPKPAERIALETAVALAQTRPRISILSDACGASASETEAFIASVRAQWYADWELCLVVSVQDVSQLSESLQTIEKSEPRIRLLFSKSASERHAALARSYEGCNGDFVTVTRGQDLLEPHSLLKLAAAVGRNPEVDMIYSDEDEFQDPRSPEVAFFKPSWSPEYLEAHAYTGHLALYRRSLVEMVGGFRSQYGGAQQYDLVLRLSRLTDKIHHLPDVLYHCRKGETDEGEKAFNEAAKSALEDFLKQDAEPGTVEDGALLGFFRVRRNTGTPRVSIVIPTASKKLLGDPEQRWLLEICINSIHEKSTYTNFEIVVIDNNDMPAELRRRVGYPGVRFLNFVEPFNLAEKINMGGFAAEGEHLIILNDDTEILTPGWIEALLELSVKEGVGAVGAKLLYPDLSVQHAGVTIINRGPGHVFYGVGNNHPGYHGSNLCNRNWLAVTGACMMTRKALFEKVGGYSPSFPLNYNDVDYCLKLKELGYRSVFTPHAQLIHYESVSKVGWFQSELDNYLDRWGTIVEDPYYNPHLSRAGNFHIDPLSPTL